MVQNIPLQFQSISKSPSQFIIKKPQNLDFFQTIKYHNSGTVIVQNIPLKFQLNFKSNLNLFLTVIHLYYLETKTVGDGHEDAYMPPDSGPELKKVTS